MSDATNMSQSLQSCQNKLDLLMQCFGDLVKYAVHENEDEKKMELLTFIHNSNKSMEKFTEMLFKEPKIKRLKQRSFETTGGVPDKKLKLSPSPLMDLPNETWMKILSYLPTYDILKNFNLTCKHFHSLAINPSAIKFIQLNLQKIEESTQYQEFVKLLKRSKALNKLIINGHGRMNHVLSHAFKSKRLKILEVSTFDGTLSKKNLEHLKNSRIAVLKLDEIILKDDAMQQIGAMKMLKSVRIWNSLGARPMNISDLIKNFIDAKIAIEDLALGRSMELNVSTLSKFLEERAESLKKLKIRCTLRDDDKKGYFKWNVPSNLEELYYQNYGRSDAQIKIEFGLETPKLTKLAICNIDGEMLNWFGTQNFPVLERLYLEKEFSNHNDFSANQQTISNLLRNCPSLKSVKLVGLGVSDPQPVDDWCAFLHLMYKTYNVYIDILGSHHWSSWNKSPMKAFEKFLKKTDLATFYKYKKMKANYLEWKEEQPEREW